MKQKRLYKTYTREFKQEAVRLMETTDRPASEIAMELGIRRNQLYKWKDQLALKSDMAFSGSGRPKIASDDVSATALGLGLALDTRCRSLWIVACPGSSPGSLSLTLEV